VVDWDGAGYERVSELQRTMARRALAALTLAGDERALDVGCGDGSISRLVAAALPHGSVLGIDPSPRMIDAARSAPVPPGADLRFAEGDMLDLSFDREFDLVYSFNALHWVRDQATALGGLARAVRPGGRVLLRFVCGGPRPSLERTAMAVCDRDRWRAAFAGFPAPFRHPDPTEFETLVSAAGLEVRSAHVSDEDWDFGSREAFARWCTVGFADWTARLEEADVAAWVDDVVAAYEQVVPQPGRFRFLQLTLEAVPAR
jgi:trans-aconitate 2-methyltransferase